MFTRKGAPPSSLPLEPKGSGDIFGSKKSKVQFKEEGPLIRPPPGYELRSRADKYGFDNPSFEPRLFPHSFLDEDVEMTDVYSAQKVTEEQYPIPKASTPEMIKPSLKRARTPPTGGNTDSDRGEKTSTTVLNER